MEQQNIPKQKSSKKWLYILSVLVIALVVFLFLQDKKIEKQQAIKMQFIEEKNWMKGFINFQLGIDGISI